MNLGDLTDGEEAGVVTLSRCSPLRSDNDSQSDYVGLFSSGFAIAAVAATLFALAHYPQLELMLLTLVAGNFLTLVYRRFPNLWAVGILHGILGSLAVYVVLEEDPGRTILDFVFGH